MTSLLPRLSFFLLILCRLLKKKLFFLLLLSLLSQVIIIDMWSCVSYKRSKLLLAHGRIILLSRNVGPDKEARRNGNDKHRDPKDSRFGRVSPKEEGGNGD